jgi:predicted esterase
MSRPTWLPLAVSLLVAVKLLTTVPVARGEVTRADAAWSFLAFEEALLEAEADTPARGRAVLRFDRVANFTFRGMWADAAQGFDALTLSLQPVERRTSPHVAALATQVTADPAVAVPGKDESVRLRLRPVYPTPGRGRLAATIRDEAGLVVAELPFDRTGDEVDWRIGDVPPGRYVVEVLGFRRGTVTVAADRPSRLREALLLRIERLEPTPALQSALRAVRARIELLDDTPDFDATTGMLSDQSALVASLPEEVAALERGENPFASRQGDYWRTFRLPTGGAVVPARLFVPETVAEQAEVPLVVALHGAGGDEHLFMEGYGAGLLRRLAEEHGFVLVTPLTYPAIGNNRAMTELVDAVSALYPVDGRRVYAIGHSLGAVATTSWMTTTGHGLAGAALLAGGVNLPATPDGTAVPTFLAAAEGDRIFRPATMMRFADRLRERGTPVHFRLYENEGHISVVAASLPDAVDWLLEQQAP